MKQIETTFQNKEARMSKKESPPYLYVMAKHLALLFHPEFGLNLESCKEYEYCTIEKWGIYCGMEWTCNHKTINRIRVLLTGADLYCVTVWKNTKTQETNVVDLFTQEPVERIIEEDRETIDRIFNFDLDAVLLYLFGYEERPKTDGKSYNIDGENE